METHKNNKQLQQQHKTIKKAEITEKNIPIKSTDKMHANAAITFCGTSYYYFYCLAHFVIKSVQLCVCLMV